MRHLHPSHIIFVIFLILFFTFPQQVTTSITHITSVFAHYFGGFVLLSCVFFVGICAYIAFGRYGHIVLGAADEKPQFSRLSWLSMLFAAGMGAGLIFYGAAEPLQHFTNPPIPSDDTLIREQARHAMVVTYFHWGIHAWAIYGIAAITMAYFVFCHKSVMLPSAILTKNKYIMTIIDTVVILAVIFGLVSSLLQGVSQLTSGFELYWEQATTITTSIVILAVLFLCYMCSAATPIGKGIKILSNVNILIAMIILLFVFLCGPTSFIFDVFVTGIGDYIENFISLSFNVRPFAYNSHWTENWTITYFLWWISWSPFVGVFIARISRGRTLKEFMIAVVLVPTLLSLFWFATFGGGALYFDIFSNMPFTASQKEELEGIIYVLLSKLPLADIMPVIIMVLLFIFLVTSADSGTFILGMFTSGGHLEPSVYQRLFWGIVIGLVTLLVLTSGKDLAFFRALTMLGAIPYLIIMLCQSVIFIKKLHQYKNI